MLTNSFLKTVASKYKTLSDTAREFLQVPKVDTSKIENKYSSFKENVQDKYTNAKEVLDKKKYALSHPNIDTSGIAQRFANWMGTSIDPNSNTGKVATGINKANDFISNKMGIFSTIANTPQKYGTMSGELIGEGAKQMGVPTFRDGKKIPSVPYESTIPFTNVKVNPYVAGTAKIGLGALGITRIGVAQGYASDIAEKGAEYIFGEDSLASTGIGLAAGFMIPGGEGQDIAKARMVARSEKGQKLLSLLTKEKRLAHLLTYQDELVKIGYKQKDLGLISAREAAYILDKGISPLEYHNIVPTGSAMVEQGKKVYQDAKQAYADWANARNASKLEGLKKSKQFGEFDNLGMDGIFEFQTGTGKEKFNAVKNYFDTRFDELKNAGVNTNYKNDYLPQIWNNTKEEIEKVFKKTLTKNPSFTMESVIKDYKQGMELGLTPKFEKLSELTAWYEQSTSKAIADKSFLKYLNDTKLILPETKAPRDWISLSEGFPKFTQKVGNEIYSGAFKAEPELAKLINNYFADPTGPIDVAAKIFTRIKNIGLSGGIPGTSLNYHGIVNIFRRDLVSSTNPVKTFFRDVKWMVNTKSASKYVEQNLDDAIFFQKHGLTITAEDWDKFTKEISKNKFEQAENWWDKVMGDPLFKRTLPAIKVDFAKKQYTDLLKNFPEEEAAKLASKVTNDIFGGINLDELGRAKEMQNFFRALFLAPDWSESNIRIGGGIVKGLISPNNPQYKAYRTVAKNMIFFSVLENITNKIMSGHWMFQNEPGREFYIDTGTYTSEGKKRYFTSWGTAQDFWRVPSQVVMNIIKSENAGDVVNAFVSPIQNRFSLPVSAGIHLGITKKDYRGRPLYADQWGNSLPVKQQVGGVLNEVLSGVGVPPQVRGPIDLAFERTSPEEMVAQSLEAPVRYYDELYGKKEEEKFELLKSSGYTSEQAVERVKARRKDTGGESLLDKVFSLFKTPKETTVERTDPLLKYLDIEAKRNENAEKVKTILETASTREEAEKMLSEQGLPDFETATVTVIRSMGVTDGVRPDYLQETLQGLQGEEFGKQLKFYMEKGIVTTGVIDYWEEMGNITDEQAKKFKTLIKVSKGTSTGKAKKKTFTKIPVSKISNVSPAKIKVQTRKATTFKPLKAKKLNIPKFAIK